MKDILILGGGRIGSALSAMCGKGGHSVHVWDIVPEMSRTNRPVEELAKSANIIIFGIPSQAVSEMCEKLKPHLKPDALVVTLSKGIDTKTRKTMDEILADALGSQPFALLSGPMLAEELVKGMGGAAVVGTARAEDFRRLCETFEGTGLHLEHSDDVHGVALAGVLKNVFAIGLGIAGGLGWGENMKGWLVAHSSKEMRTIIELLGGQKETALTQAGLGDMVATGFSPHSSNHKFGKTLAETGTCDIRSEGCVSLPPLSELLRGKTEGLIVYEALRSIVINNADAKEIFGNLSHVSC